MMSRPKMERVVIIEVKEFKNLKRDDGRKHKYVGIRGILFLKQKEIARQTTRNVHERT